MLSKRSMWDGMPTWPTGAVCCAGAACGCAHVRYSCWSRSMRGATVPCSPPRACATFSLDASRYCVGAGLRLWCAPRPICDPCGSISLAQVHMLASI
jgi:hypothetical protein